MFRKLLAGATAVVATAAFAVVGLAAPASAASGDPVPYTITPTSLTLPGGHTFNSSSPTNDGQVNYIPLSQYQPGETYLHHGSGWTIININFHIEQNAGHGAGMIGRSTLPFDPVASDGAFKGVLPASGYCIVWVQVDGFDEHFGEGGQAPICSSVMDATAEVSTTPGTCDAPGTLVLGATHEADWGAPDLTTVSGRYTVTATAHPGHLFSDGTSALTLSGAIPSQATEGCGPRTIVITTAPHAEPATCTAGGTLVVPAQDHIVWTGGTDGAGSGDYTVVATIAPGDAASYSLGGQTSWHVIVPAAGVNLDGSSMNCHVLDKNYVVPTATAVSGCSTGSISYPTDAATAAKVTYRLISGNGTTGTNVVEATAVSPWVFPDNTTTKDFTFELGSRVDCVDPSPKPATASTAVTCSVDGTYTLPVDANVRWKVVRGTVTSTDVAPGTYSAGARFFDVTVTITALPAAGVQFATGATTSWTFPFVAPADCLPTLAQLPVTWTHTDAICTIGGTPLGTITPGTADEVGYVAYTVDGSPVIAGATVRVAAGDHVLVGTAVQTGDTVDPAGPQTVTVKAAPTLCPTDLKTLALTGDDPLPWLIGGLAVLQLGVALVAVHLLRRRRHGRHAA
jgi:hypothetical protein